MLKGAPPPAPAQRVAVATRGTGYFMAEFCHFFKKKYDIVSGESHDPFAYLHEPKHEVSLHNAQVARLLKPALCFHQVLGHARALVVDFPYFSVCDLLPRVRGLVVPAESSSEVNENTRAPCS